MCVCVCVRTHTHVHAYLLEFYGSYLQPNSCWEQGVPIKDCLQAPTGLLCTPGVLNTSIFTKRRQLNGVQSSRSFSASQGPPPGSPISSLSQNNDCKGCRCIIRGNRSPDSAVVKYFAFYPAILGYHDVSEGGASVSGDPESFSHDAVDGWM